MYALFNSVHTYLGRTNATREAGQSGPIMRCREHVLQLRHSTEKGKKKYKVLVAGGLQHVRFLPLINATSFQELVLAETIAIKQTDPELNRLMEVKSTKKNRLLPSSRRRPFRNHRRPKGTCLWQLPHISSRLFVGLQLVSTAVTSLASSPFEKMYVQLQRLSPMAGPLDIYSPSNWRLFLHFLCKTSGCKVVFPLFGQGKT